MSFVSQTTSPTTPGTLIGAIHISKAILEGLYAEIPKPDPSHHKSPSEAIGLLFGTVDSTSARLEHFEPVNVDDFGASIPAGAERLHDALEERISAIRSGSAQDSVLLGWYVSRSDDSAGLLDRVIMIHNAFFQNDHDVAITLKREAKGHFAVEVYAAKPGTLLARNNHRVGSWHSANLNALPEQVSLTLSDSVNNELFLNVYRTAKLLDQAESRGNWERIRKYTVRMIPTFGNSARTGQDRLFGTGLTSIGTPVSPTAAALTPEKRPSSLPPLQTWLPPSLAAASIAKKKNLGFLRTTAWLLGTIIISVLTYIAAHLYLKPMLLNLTGQSSTAAVAASPKPVSAQPVFGLKVSQNGTALELQWNPLYPPVQLATSGKLIITDGTSNREIEMDRTQLRSGRIVYIPTSGDVRFSLKVMDSPSRTITDSIRVLATPSERIPNGTRRYDSDRMPLHRDVRGGPVVDHPASGVIQSGSSKNQNRTSTSFGADTENRAAGSAEKMSAPLVVRLVSSVPQFDILPNLPTSLSSPREPANNPNQASYKETGSGLSRQDLPLADRAQINSKITPGPTDRRVPLSTPPETTRQQAPGSSPLLPVQQPSFNPAVAMYRQYPTLRRGMLFSNVVVPVIVHINETGKITSVALAPSTSPIRPEISKKALAAARKWRFSPAKIGDKAVSSEMRINFVFKPSQTADGIAP